MSSVQDAPATLAPDRAAEALAPAPYLFTAEAFERLIAADVFAEGDRVELWEGMVTTKMAKTQAHVAAGINVLMTIARILPPNWCLSSENPVALTPQSMPLPDFAVLRGDGYIYNGRRPMPGDVGLLMELALTSLRADVGPRLMAYAAANIPVYWVINLVENVVLVFERPVPPEGRYELTHTYAIGQTVPLRLDGVLVAEIPAIDLLPVRG